VSPDVPRLSPHSIFLFSNFHPDRNPALRTPSYRRVTLDRIGTVWAAGVERTISEVDSAEVW